MVILFVALAILASYLFTMFVLRNFGVVRNVIRLDGKTAIVTGANCGIGKETALDLARRGAQVIMACRDMQKGERALQEIRRESGNPNVHLRNLDLASLNSVRRFSESILKEFSELHLLINNAGVMSCPLSKTEDGFEMHIGVNHFGHFALTNLLLRRMAETNAPTRVVVLASFAHTYGWINFTDINFERRFYIAMSAYAQSKLANILFAKELQRKVNHTNITVYSVHPGIVLTELTRHDLLAALFYQIIRIFVGRNCKEGAQTSIYCATEPDIEIDAGEYFADCKVTSVKRAIIDDEGEARKLWELSEQLTNVHFPI